METCIQFKKGSINADAVCNYSRKELSLEMAWAPNKEAVNVETSSWLFIIIVSHSSLAIPLLCFILVNFFFHRWLCFFFTSSFLQFLFSFHSNERNKKTYSITGFLRTKTQKKKTPRTATCLLMYHHTTTLCARSAQLSNIDTRFAAVVHARHIESIEVFFPYPICYVFLAMLCVCPSVVVCLFAVRQSMFYASTLMLGACNAHTLLLCARVYVCLKRQTHDDMHDCVFVWVCCLFGQ